MSKLATKEDLPSLLTKEELISQIKPLKWIILGILVPITAANTVATVTIALYIVSM